MGLSSVWWDYFLYFREEEEKHGIIIEQWRHVAAMYDRIMMVLFMFAVIGVSIWFVTLEPSKEQQRLPDWWAPLWDRGQNQCICYLLSIIIRDRVQYETGNYALATLAGKRYINIYLDRTPSRSQSGQRLNYTNSAIVAGQICVYSFIILM